MAIFLGHGSRHEGAISPTLSMGYDTVPKPSPDPIQTTGPLSDNPEPIQTTGPLPSTSSQPTIKHAMDPASAVPSHALSAASPDPIQTIGPFSGNQQRPNSPDSVQTGGYQQPHHQSTVKATVNPAPAATNPALHADHLTSLDFLRPQGSIYCQTESILQQAISQYRIEDSLMSN